MTDSTPPAGSRSYGGKDAAARSDERRQKLLAAGLELFGTQGYAATSVKALCTEAGLTERYLWFRDDPRRARVQLIEPLTIGPQMTELYRQVTGGFIIMLRDVALRWFGPAFEVHKLDAQLLSTAMVGAVVEMTKAWVLEGCPQPVEEMVHNAMAIYTAFTEKLGA